MLQADSAACSRLTVRVHVRARVAGELAGVTAVVTQLAFLENLYLRGNSFNGSLDCGLVQHPSLKVGGG